MKVVGRIDPLVNDIEFVFAECQRLQEIASTGLKAVPREDLWCHIPHPSSAGGHMLCGRAARERLDELAERVLRQANLIGRVSLPSARKKLEALVVDRFLREGRPLDRRQVDRVLASVGREVAKLCLDKTHFIPCHLLFRLEPSLLQLGPVIFRTRKSFAGELARHVRTLRKDREPPFERWDRRSLLAVLKYYRAFKWVAEITVDRCDTDSSSAIANRTVASALDCLHLLLGAGNSTKMEVGGPGIRRDHRGSLVVEAMKVVHPGSG